MKYPFLYCPFIAKTAKKPGTDNDVQRLRLTGISVNELLAFKYSVFL
jgi:hypothetical protein